MVISLTFFSFMMYDYIVLGVEFNNEQDSPIYWLIEVLPSFSGSSVADCAPAPSGTPAPNGVFAGVQDKFAVLREGADAVKTGVEAAKEAKSWYTEESARIAKTAQAGSAAAAGTGFKFLQLNPLTRTGIIVLAAATRYLSTL